MDRSKSREGKFPRRYEIDPRQEGASDYDDGREYRPEHRPEWRDYRYEERRDLGAPHRHISSFWTGPFVSGLLIALVGIIAFWTPLVTGVASALLIGGLLTFAGAVELIGSFRRRHEGSVAHSVLSGILSLVVGILFLARPVAGVGALGLMLAAYFFASGLFRVINSAADRYSRWGWDFAYGLVALAAGVMVLMYWPLSSLVLVGMLIGLELLARGIALMGIGWGMRSFLQRGGFGGHYGGQAPASV